MGQLQKQPLPIQFSGGIETKQDSKQIPTTRLIDLQNCTFIKQTTLAKRNGYEALGNTVDGTNAIITNPQGLGVRGSELLQFASSGQVGAPVHALSYIDATDRWSDAGPVDSVVASSVPLARTGTQQSQPDVATNRGITVAAWEDSNGGAWAEVVDAESLRIIVSPTQLDAAGQRPRCLRVGQVLHILYAVPATGIIWTAIVDPANPSGALTPQPLVVDLDPTNPIYDAEPTGIGYSADQPAIITWCNAAGVSYRIGYIHPSGVLGSPVTGLPSAGTVAATIGGAIGIAWWQTNPSPLVAPRALVAYSDSVSLKIDFQFHDGTNLASLSLPGGAAIGAGTNYLRIACAWDDSQVWVAAEDTGAGDATTNVIRSINIPQSGVVGHATPTLRGHGLATRAFYDQGGVCVGVVHPALFFSYVAVVRLSAGFGPAVPVGARVLTGQSPGLLTRTHLPSVIPVGVDVNSGTNVATVHQLPLLYRLQLESSTGKQFTETGLQVFSLDYDNPESWQTAQLGRGLYLGSACMQAYDGRIWSEADFHCAPDNATGAIATVTAAGGTMTSSGKYLYQLCYESIDGQGELHRGAVSPGPLVTMGVADTQVTLTIPTCRLTGRSRVRVGVYRSLFNEIGDPTTITFFRVASVDPTTSGAAANGYVLSDPTVDTVTFVDRMSDATLATMEPLYTDGGIRSNDPPANGGGVVVGGSNRLFFTDPLDPNMVRYSQELADAVSVEMVQSLNLRCDPYGGSVVGIGILDDAKIVFKETAVFAFGGPGPDPNPDAGQNAWTPPQLLTSDVGCKAPRSIVQTPIGIAWQSEKGVMLLGRDRQVQDIGKAVYAYNDQTIVRATLLPDRHQIVFLTNAGRTLLYDYHPDIQQWSTYTNHEGLDAVVVDGVYHYLRTDGRVFRETPGVYKDDNAHIPMRIETAWVKMAGYLQGWQNCLWVYFLGTYLSEHTLRMRYRIDYQEAYSAPIDMDVDSNYNPSLYGAGSYGVGDYGGPGGASTVYQRRKHLNKRCQAISFRIEDVEDTGSFGASFQLSELLLIGGVLAPDFKPGAARST